MLSAKVRSFSGFGFDKDAFDRSARTLYARFFIASSMSRG